MIVRFWWLVDKRALLVTAGCLALWRLLNAIPVVDITGTFIHTRLELYTAPGFFAAIGPNSLVFEAYSLDYFGIVPYIQTLVLMTFAVWAIRPLREMAATAEGRLRIERWTRAFALLLAVGGGDGFTYLAQNAGAVPDLDWFARLAMSLQIAGGTAVMILLSDLLDEHGLGFGYGAVIFYGLELLAFKLHQLAGYMASAPSIEALYKPLAMWTVLTVAVTMASVFLLLAYRRVLPPRGTPRGQSMVDLKVLTSGFLRPGLITFGVLGFPSVLGHYVSYGPSPLRWFIDNWTPYGSAAWLDITYVVVEASALVFFAAAVAAMDGYVAIAPDHVSPHLIRLGFIGGVAMAVLIAVVRPAARYATQSAGQLLSVSGFDILLVVGVVLMVILWIEHRAASHPLTMTPALLP